MKYTVKHCCGHEEVHTLFGKRDQREWRLAKLAEEKCSECQAKDRAAFNEKKAQENKEAGLPELAGTPKQVAWAESIRSEKIKELEKLKSYISDNIRPEAKHMLDGVLKIIDDTINQTSAEEWINNRSTEFDIYWLEHKL